MLAAWVRAISELRARWRAWLVIALMLGIAGGVVMAAAAGARRTDNAVPRFLRYAQASTAFVGTDPSGFHAIAALPQVEAASALARLLTDDPVSRAAGRPLSVLAFTDPALHTRPVLEAGRFFD